MEYKSLGNTGIKVSYFCFGVLPMGPLQANISPEEGGKLLKKAYSRGINFIDTAQMYKTYPHIKESLKELKDEDVVIASKSGATDYKGMEDAVHEALKEMGRNYIDIFHLHSAKSKDNVFEEKAEALKCLLDCKAKGLIKAVGISSHNVKVIEKAALNPDIDVVYPIINEPGFGIINGTTKEMLEAIKLCSEKGKGLYAMKIFAGGNLVGDIINAFNYAKNIKEMDSLSIGMINEKELDFNLKLFSNEITQEMLPECKNSKKMILLPNICIKCRKCMAMCPNDAIYVENDTMKIDESKCLLCGYCSTVCPEFAIRMI